MYSDCPWLVVKGKSQGRTTGAIPCRPFLVSGGAEDPPERWSALVHAVAVNQLLGWNHRVAMTHRPTHDPTAEANEQVALFFEWALQAKKQQ
jgi:hypothetical protein